MAGLIKDIASKISNTVSDRINRKRGQAKNVSSGNSDSTILSMDCAKCGAPLNLDIDNLIKFCPYCGSKILVDPKAFRDVLIEKEKTKRKQMDCDQEQRKQEAIDKQRPKKILFMVLFGIVGLFLLGVGILFGSLGGDSFYAIGAIGIMAIFGSIYFRTSAFED